MSNGDANRIDFTAASTEASLDIGIGIVAAGGLCGECVPPLDPNVRKWVVGVTGFATFSVRLPLDTKCVDYLIGHVSSAILASCAQACLERRV